MKSKSLNVPKCPSENVNQNKTFDFINYYKSAAETNVKLLESTEGSKDKSAVKGKHHPPKSERLSRKVKKDRSGINIEPVSSPYVVVNSLLKSSKVTSTPNIHKKNIKAKVKSIMKTKQLTDESIDVSDISISTISKPKKRNKSVSFMLDETEEVAIKKSKSEETIVVGQTDNIDLKSLAKTKKPKRNKKRHQNEKENRGNTNNTEIETVPLTSVKTQSQQSKNIESYQPSEVAKEPTNEMSLNGKADKIKRSKHLKIKSTDKTELDLITANTETDNNNKKERNDFKEDKFKKLKQKKRKQNVKSDTTATDKEDEPVVKSQKKECKPDIIVQDLENLNIGDNAHTLTNLLDDMTVVDKSKKKKQKDGNKNKQNKKNKQSEVNNDCNTVDDNVEEKEKVKWIKRKWNKDKKGGLNVDKHLTSIVVENLPLKIVCSYKKLLSEHFEKCGMIKQVGIVEVYPTEDPKPVFTTTINFYSEDAANKAFDEDNTVFEGNRIRIKKPLPPVETTLVVRSYAELTEQALSSVFTGAGRIRNIRHLVKGKKSLSTVFIEFDGPESVERAIQMSEEAKIGGKKIHVAKFVERKTNKKMRKETMSENSEDSND